LSNYFILAQEKNCDRTTNFGEVEICLPQIEGYQECYTEPTVKEIADATEVSINEVVGYYLNNKSFEKKDSLGLIAYDDFFKIYATKELKDYKSDSKFLKEMSDVLGGNFVIKNWESIEGGIQELDLGVEIGAPTVIKKYNLNENSFSYMFLLKYEFEGQEPYIMSMTINGLLLNERLIWMAYYLYYENDETIKRLEKTSNAIILKLLAANN
jgi:hypothetical protein